MSETPGQRLRILRRERGWTQAQMAAFLGVRQTAYANHENGTRSLRDVSDAYARRLQVNRDWLCYGRGPRRGSPSQIAVMGMVGAGAVVAAPTDEGYVDPIEFVDLPAVEDVCAYVVAGDSQYPRFMAGDIIVAARAPANPERLLNRTAVVETDDGEKMVKKIMRGRRVGLFRLWSHNAPDMPDVLLRAAFPILYVILRS
jgi:DNA-binding XRE family transcriptional regulator